jgi:hypothetical protein
MSSTPTTTTGITVSSDHSHHRGKRLRHFMLPDGRKVHIALSPEEAESLRQRLTAVRKDEPFDLVISGSPEHLNALRQAHSHYDERREMLRVKHGSDYDEFENVRAELDTLSSELHMLTDHVSKFSSLFFLSECLASCGTYPSMPGKIMQISSRCLGSCRTLKFFSSEWIWSWVLYNPNEVTLTQRFPGCAT